MRRGALFILGLIPLLLLSQYLNAQEIIKPKKFEFKIETGIEGLTKSEKKKKNKFELKPRYELKSDGKFGKIIGDGSIQIDRSGLFTSHNFDYTAPGRLSFFSMNLQNRIGSRSGYLNLKRTFDVIGISGIGKDAKSYFKSIIVQQFSSNMNLEPLATDISWETQQFSANDYLVFSSYGYLSLRNHNQPDYFRSNLLFKQRSSDAFNFSPEFESYNNKRSLKVVFRVNF